MTPSTRTSAPLGELRFEVELRRADIDPLSHVRPGSYHAFLGEARAALLDRLGLRERGEFVNAHVELDHRHEVVPSDGRVIVVLTVGKIGRSSFEVLHDVLTPDGTIAATGRTVLAAWDSQARRSRPLGEADLDALRHAAAR